MRQKIIRSDSFNIHLIKSKKFKTIDVRVVFSDAIVKTDISRRSFLFDILINSCKKYKTKRLLNIRCQELYSLHLSSGTFRLGNYLISKIGVSFLNPKFTEESMLEESLDLLKEVLFNPHVKYGAFDNQRFQIIKKDLEDEINTIREQPRLYANIRLLENMGEDLPYCYRGFCYQEDLDQITPKNLYDYYQELLDKSLIDIYVIGDYDMVSMEKVIKKAFKFPSHKKEIIPVFVEHNGYRDKANEVIEGGDYRQSKLAISYKLKDLTDFERNFVSNMYSMLLGGISDSILMKNVRAKSSLAYYINSSLAKADNMIVINAGIDRSNYDKTMVLIKSSLKDIAEGNFSDEDVVKCQKEYVGALDIASQTPGGVIDLSLSSYLLGTKDVETRKTEILKVTKEDIVKFAQKVIVDTIYLLKGEQ